MTQPVQPGQALPWAMGLRSASGLYLTVEPFGNRISITSKVMKKKQIFVLEPQHSSSTPASTTTVALRTHLNKYLAAKPDGSLTADAETVTGDALFTMITHDAGYICFQSAHGFYLGGSGEHVDAYGRERTAADRQFFPNLAVHPQMNIWNTNRKTFMHLDGDAICTDELIPWGDDAVITLCYLESTNKYTLQACDGRFLHSDGSLHASAGADAELQLELWDGCVAFKAASNGRYLTSVGGKGLCRATKLGPPTANELFVMEDSQPQIKLTTTAGKRVTCGLTSALQATQTKQTTDSEQFQLELGPDGTWAIRTCKNTFVRLHENQLHADATEKGSPGTRFHLEWHGPRIAIVAANGKYVTTLKTGILTAAAGAMSDEASFVYELTNRPRLVLRSPYGFVNTGVKDNLMCNKARAEVIHMHVRAGVCEISSSNGKYWAPSSDLEKVTATADAPFAWYLDFVALSKIGIFCTMDDGSRRYICCDKNGTMACTATAPGPDALFEF